MVWLRYSVWALALVLLAGCVQRRMIIVSNPPGAVVLVNGEEIGATPVDVPSHLFQYYGDYEFKLVRDGYEPLLIKQAVPAPWYEWPGLDFFSENAIPFRLKDRRVFQYDLLPAQIVPPEVLLQNAAAARSQGQQIGPPPDEPILPASGEAPPPQP